MRCFPNLSCLCVLIVKLNSLRDLFWIPDYMDSCISVYLGSVMELYEALLVVSCLPDFLLEPCFLALVAACVRINWSLPCFTGLLWQENPPPFSLGYWMCQLIMSMGGEDLLPGSPVECALRSGWEVTNGWPLWLGESTDSIFKQGCSVGSLTRQGCWLCSIVTWGALAVLCSYMCGQAESLAVFLGRVVPLVGCHGWAGFWAGFCHPP